MGTLGDATFRAFDKDNGKVLWEKKMESNPEGLPAIYEVDGRNMSPSSYTQTGSRVWRARETELRATMFSLCLRRLRLPGNRRSKRMRCDKVLRSWRRLRWRRPRWLKRPRQLTRARPAAVFIPGLPVLMDQVRWASELACAHDLRSWKLLQLESGSAGQRLQRAHVVGGSDQDR